MNKVLDDGMILTLGVVGVVAAAGAVAGRSGSRSMGNAILWTRPREGELEAEVFVPEGEGGRRVPSHRVSAKVRHVGQNVEWDVLDRGRVVAHGVEGNVIDAKKSAGRSVEMLISGQHGSRSKYREGHEAPHGSAYVVVNLMSHGKKRIHGPFSSAQQAEAWGKAHGEDVSVKAVNLVSKGMEGDFMVIEEHGSFEVFHGFFKTSSVASRWINRQPDEQTLENSFVVRVHRP